MFRVLVVRGERRRFLVGRLVLRDAGWTVFPVAGLAGNAFRFAFTGNLLIELIDDVLELVSPTQRVFFFGFRHIASIDFETWPAAPRRHQPTFFHTLPCALVTRCRCPSFSLPVTQAIGDVARAA